MIYDVFDERFRPYGRVVREFDGARLCQVLRSQTPVPEGTCYVPEADCLMALPEREALERHILGGLPVQMGWCNGHNTVLNCLEYHRSCWESRRIYGRACTTQRISRRFLCRPVL